MPLLIEEKIEATGILKSKPASTDTPIKASIGFTFLMIRKIKTKMEMSKEINGMWLVKFA